MFKPGDKVYLEAKIIEVRINERTETRYVTQVFTRRGKGFWDIVETCEEHIRKEKVK